MPPRDLLAATQSVERSFHRERTVRWGPRTLDIDILAMGPLLVDEPDLLIPHARAHERAFVLVPLAEIAPELRHPVLGITVREMLERLPPGETEKVWTAS